MNTAYKILNWVKAHWVFSLIILFILAWTALLFLVSPSELIEKIGIQNTYIVAFLLAVFGGISTLSSAPFFTAVVTFASGGANPLILGLTGGLGVFISDTAFFFIARHGVITLNKKTNSLTRYLANKTHTLHPIVLFSIIFVYLAFTPLPNDILMIALALSGMKYKQLAPILFVASFAVVTLTAYLGQQLLSLIF